MKEWRRERQKETKETDKERGDRRRHTLRDTKTAEETKRSAARETQPGAARQGKSSKTRRGSD